MRVETAKVASRGGNGKGQGTKGTRIWMARRDVDAAAIARWGLGELGVREERAAVPRGEAWWQNFSAGSARGADSTSRDYRRHGGRSSRASKRDFFGM